MIINVHVDSYAALMGIHAVETMVPRLRSQISALSPFPLHKRKCMYESEANGITPMIL